MTGMTPWQKVAAKFGVGRGSQTLLADAIGMHRSSVNRYVRHPLGLINARHQIAIIKAARERGIEITPADLMPDSSAMEAIGGDQGHSEDDDGNAPDATGRRAVR